MSSTAVLGCMFGDEAKAKIVDVLANNSDFVVRFQGGSNAGHTIVSNGKKIVLHSVPSGILYDKTVCILGSGVVVDPFALNEEITQLEEQGINVSNRFFIDPRAHIVLPIHRELDSKSENDKRNNTKIGTTKRGIGPTYADKSARFGIRFSDLYNIDYLKERLTNLYFSHNLEISKEEIDKLVESLSEVSKKFEPFKMQVPYFINEQYEKGADIIFEGAQGTLLDIDYGTFPFVTSSHTVSGSITIGCGISPKKIDRIVGVFKSYFSRVGEGPFPTELFDEIGNTIREQGHEFGSTTGRPRRCGWFDAIAAKYSAMINGVDEIALTLLDVLSGLKTIKICTAYIIDGKRTLEFPYDTNSLNNCVPEYIELPGWNEDITKIKNYDDLPKNAKNYIESIEELMDKKVSIVSVGPDRNQTIFRS